MTDLLTRPAGYEVARACLAQQSERPARSSVQRLFGIDPMHPDAVSWFQGTLGEIRVGRVLAKLGPEWTVVHSVPIGTRGSDIDHILVGPAGVFTINTKRHRGKKVWVGDRRILVAGQKTDHLRNARYEAERAAGIISRSLGDVVPVTALLVIVDSAGITVKSRPDGVSVLTDGELLRWLTRRKITLDRDATARLSRIATDSRTWGAAVAADVDAGVMSSFESLRAVDARARTVRLAWATVALATLFSTALWALPRVAEIVLTGLL
ncbi:MAG: nuclease-related domain-containing protein [Microbacteriaceae bacterium]